MYVCLKRRRLHIGRACIMSPERKQALIDAEYPLFAPPFPPTRILLTPRIAVPGRCPGTQVALVRAGLERILGPALRVRDFQGWRSGLDYCCPHHGPHPRSLFRLHHPGSVRVGHLCAAPAESPRQSRGRVGEGDCQRCGRRSCCIRRDRRRHCWHDRLMTTGRLKSSRFGGHVQ